MNKVLFLDFDGVLTSYVHSRKCMMEHRQENMYGMDWFDPACLDALSLIVEKTGAGIVVSSSWRELGMARLTEVWKQIPVPGELIETTPVWILTKKEAIDHWIKMHPEERYVILDDQDLKMSCQVKTDPHIGLTMEDAQAAVEMLIE